MSKKKKPHYIDTALAHRPVTRRGARLCPKCASVAQKHIATNEVRCAKHTCEYYFWHDIKDWNARLSESEKRLLAAIGEL